MKNIIFAVALYTVSVGSIWASPPFGASFIKINQSPATAALGGAGSAMIADVSSLYINPAGLSSMNSTQLWATHTELFEDSSMNSFAFGYPFGLESKGQTIGLGVTYLNYGAIEARDANRQTVGSFRPSDLAATLSYARIVGPLTAGLSVKAIQEKIAGDSASGVAADLGTQWNTPLRGLHLGLSLLNVGPSMKFISEKYSLPTTARFGVGYSIGLFNVLSDVGVPAHGGKNWYALGTEFRPVSMLSLRAGYLTTGESRLADKSTSSQLAGFAGFAGGIGMQIGRYQIDYAMTPHQQLGNTQQFSFSMNFR